MDLINALFELGGAIFVWLNVFTLVKDKKVQGISWLAQVFFAVWGVWNLIYYPSLGQTFSFIASGLVAAGNFTWVILLWRYERAH